MESIIEDYISELYKIQQSTFGKGRFAQNSYSIYFAKYIASMVRQIESSGLDGDYALEMLEDFIQKMEEYTLIKNSHWMFSIGYDTALEIYDRCFQIIKEEFNNEIKRII